MNKYNLTVSHYNSNCKQKLNRLVDVGGESKGEVSDKIVTKLTRLGWRFVEVIGVWEAV